MNALKTTILLGAMTGLILGFGYYLGGNDGLTFALVITIIMNIGSYWFSDKLVLRMYGGRIVNREQAPLLHRLMDEITARAGMIKPDIAIVDLPVPNAFATGRNQHHAVVAVSPPLMQILDENELRGVLAHELGHVKNRDILISSVAAALAGMISYLSHVTIFFGGGRRDNGNGNLVGLIAMAILTPVMAAIIQSAISRSREFAADDRSVQFTGNPEYLANALRKIDAASRRLPLEGQAKHEATAHLFIVNPFRSSFLMRLFSTHPPIEERIARLSQSWQSR